MTTGDQRRRIILIDPDDDARHLLAERLRAQDFLVDTAPDAASGAEQALSCPPAAVVADLWMPGISGVQLSRLLRAEPATVDVPVILRAIEDDPRSRFWAETAGSAALVTKGRMGELARVLRKLTERAVSEDAFFMHLGAGSCDIRDRLAQHLDAALFDSVIAAEVRALGTACSFDRLFDAFSQLAARLMTYRWLAIATTTAPRLAIHHHPRQADTVETEVFEALGIGNSIEVLRVVDEDATGGGDDGHIITHEISFGGKSVGRIAVASAGACGEQGSEALVALFARELGGAIRMAMLVEQSQRLATTDPLTGLLNRRAFADVMNAELARSDRCELDVAALLFDVDHFKAINDRYGHRTGDAVLAAIGELLPRLGRPYDTVARWGGEEFVALLPGTDAEGAASAAERFRRELELTVVHAAEGTISFTVSIGVAVRRAGEPLESLLERADMAMYAAKTAGRNRVFVDRVVVEVAPASRAEPTAA